MMRGFFVHISACVTSPEFSENRIDARPRGGNRQNNKTVEKKLKNVVVAPL